MDGKRGRFNMPVPAIGAWRHVKRATGGWLPSKGSALFTILVVGGLLWTGTVGADPLGRMLAGPPPPQMVNYQGRLLDAAGNTVGDGVYPLRFALYCEAEQGTPFWCEPTNCSANAQVSVSGGLFNVTLGQTNPFPKSFPCPSSPHLQVTVEGEAMLPRERLTSVPFALQTELEDGAVTTDKLADGAVTGAKLSADAIPGLILTDVVTERATDANQDEACTPQDVWKDVLSAQVALTKPSTLRISYGGLVWKTNGGGRTFLALRRGGDPNSLPPDDYLWSSIGQTTSSGWVSDSDRLFAVQVFEDMPAGSHQVSLVLGSGDGGQACIRSRYMIVEVFGR